MYIYLIEEDNFEGVPKEIFNSLGIVEFAMELDIKPSMKMAKEKPDKIISNLNEHGFHLQLTSDTSIESIMAKIAQNKLN